MSNIRPSTFDLRPSTFDFRRSTFDLRPSTFDFRPLLLAVVAVFFLAPTARAEALSEVLLLQQKTTTLINRTVVAPQAPAQQQPSRNPLVEEGIIGGSGIFKPRPAEQQSAPPVQMQQKAPPPQSQQQPRPSGPVVTHVQASGAGLHLQFVNAPLTTVIDVIMKELGFTYMVDPAVGGTVNIQTTKPIKREDLFTTLELILKLNNTAVVKSGDIYLFVPIAEGIKAPHNILIELKKKTEIVTPPPTKAPLETPPGGTPPAAAAVTEPRVLSLQGTPTLEDEKGLVTVIIPLEFIPTAEMTPIVQQFMSGGAVVLSYDPKNILIITDFRSNIETVKKLIEILDSKFFDINTTELIPVRYNRALEVVKDLNTVFTAGGEGNTSVNLIPIERLNSILVFAHSPHVLDEVHKWLEKLDSPSSGMNIQTFVYQVENSTAGNIADILSQLYSDGSGLPSQATSEGQAPTQQQQQQQQQRQSIRPQESQGGRRGLGTQLGPTLEGRPISQRSQAGTGSLLGGNVKIIVNEFNNSLIIQATEADYQYIERTIKQLDVLPRQVLIEAKIYSVELRDELSFGIAAFLEKREQKLATTASIASGKGAGALSAATRFIIGDGREIAATLNMLQTRTKVRILEAPRLLAIDGQQAHINIGADVPVTTSSFGDPAISGNAGAFLNQIQFRPTGTTLLINPRISASGMVTMDLSIEVSSAVGSSLTPTINRNYVETSAVVKDGHSVAIGGIISESDTLDRSRVPLLGDIPIIGALFGQTEKKHRRSELVILITPHVIGSVPQADAVSGDFRRALKRAYDFVNDKEKTEVKRVEDRTRKEILEEQKHQEKMLKQKPQ